jgi:hypothetical protein
MENCSRECVGFKSIGPETSVNFWIETSWPCGKCFKSFFSTALIYCDLDFFRRIAIADWLTRHALTVAESRFRGLALRFSKNLIGMYSSAGNSAPFVFWIVY